MSQPNSFFQPSLPQVPGFTFGLGPNSSKACHSGSNPENPVFFGSKPENPGFFGSKPENHGFFVSKLENPGFFGSEPEMKPGFFGLEPEKPLFFGSEPDKPVFMGFNWNSQPTPPDIPPATLDREIKKGAEEGKFMKERNEDKVPEAETTQIKFTIPEESSKKEMHDKSEDQPSTQLVVVSRILTGIPQNPHFLPLKMYSNVAKLKLINAWDNIFEETVTKLLRMQMNGFSADSMRLWETMQELEKMGYNVISLRRRLVELTEVLIKLRTHKRKIMRLKNEAEQHRIKKSRLEFEIVKLKAKAEAENASMEDLTAKALTMEDELPCFSFVFTCQSTKMLEHH